MGSYVTCVSRLMRSISHNAFARLSGPMPRPRGIRELSFGTWQGELKHGAARFVRLRPQPAAMSIDDGTAYRQPHPRSAGLGGKEGVEDAFEMRRINTRPGVAYGHEDTFLVLPAADQ